MNTGHSEEISKGKRFQFGANWKAFLGSLNEERILEAEASLRDMLNVEDLTGASFLDIGSGSGLFSLVARRLGAKVHSFDYDPQSVACAQELKKRYFDNDENWIIEEGSALDKKYLQSLGEFDIVYSWGVLHHTGNMAKALDNVMIPVSKNGTLFIAIYNDQGIATKVWTRVKKTYCSGWFGKVMISTVYIPWFTVQSSAIGLIKYKNPIGQFLHYKEQRGMSLYHDWIDWLGGYPFEAAKPEDIITLYRRHGFSLEKYISTNRLGCNQFVFLNKQ